MLHSLDQALMLENASRVWCVSSMLACNAQMPLPDTGDYKQ